MKNCFLLLVAFPLFIQIVSAQDGTLSSTYGKGGIVRADFGATVTRSSRLVKGLVDVDGSIYLVLQIDERVVVEKHFANGSIDLSFGRMGKSVVVEDLHAQTAFLTNGNILIGGGSSVFESTDIILAKIKSDGNLDSSFGQYGRRNYPFNIGYYYGESEVHGIDIQTDGKIVVIGTNVFELFVTRLNANGTNDPSFTEYRLPDADPKTVKLMPDGKILVGGGRFSFTERFLVRLNDDGSVDESFSNNGFIDSPSIDPYSYLIDDNGKILAATYNGIYRFNADGTLDNSFGTGGSVETTQFPAKMVYDPSGDIFIASTSNDEIIIKKLDQDGTKDNAFSGDGMASFDLADGETVVNLAIARNGNVLIFGNNKTDGVLEGFEVVQFKAADGTNDMTFSDDGQLTGAYEVKENTTLHASAVQADHKIVSVGTTGHLSDDLVISRSAIDGTPDNSFGNDGKTFLDIAGGSEKGMSILIKPDGKILAAGISDGKLLVAQFNSDGSPDADFNQAGYKVYDIPVHSNPYFDQSVKLILQPDGKILAHASKVVVRIQANGDLDPTFSDDGISEIDLIRSYSFALQDDGKILVAGEAFYISDDDTNDNGEDDIYFGIVRLNSDGAPDNAFRGGVKGIPMSQPNTFLSNYASSILIQPDGKILIGGSVGSDYRVFTYDWGVARLNNEGSLDNTFNSNGIFYVNTGHPGFLNDMVLQPDGKILLGGYVGEEQSVYEPQKGNFALARLNADGLLDQDYGNAGSLVPPLVYGDNRINDLEVDGDVLYATGLAEYANLEGIIARFNISGTGNAPLVTLESPRSPDVFLAPASVHLVATATSPDDKIGKVEFFNNSDLITTEYNAPYDWYWRNVPAGSYNISAKASDTKGMETTTDPVKITVVTPSVNEFILMNAVTNKRVMLLYDGIVLDKSLLPSVLNIKAITNFKKFGSVVFVLDGKTVRTENGYPYSLAGDSPAGNYNGWALPLGTHTLTAIPYNHYNAIGTAGVSLTITFTVVDNSSGLTTFDLQNGAVENIRFGVYPNPTEGILTISVSNFTPSKNAMITILTLQGTMVKKEYWNGQSSSTQISISSLPAGSYLLRVDDKKVIIKKTFVKL